MVMRNYVHICGKMSEKVDAKDCIKQMEALNLHDVSEEGHTEKIHYMCRGENRAKKMSDNNESRRRRETNMVMGKKTEGSRQKVASWVNYAHDRLPDQHCLASNLVNPNSLELGSST